MHLSVIEKKIHEIRGKVVMPGFDLAQLREVENRRLKEAVRKNRKRFPPDFMFELTRNENNLLRSQFVSSERG